MLAAVSGWAECGQVMVDSRTDRAHVRLPQAVHKEGSSNTTGDGLVTCFKLAVLGE